MSKTWLADIVNSSRSPVVREGNCAILEITGPLRLQAGLKRRDDVVFLAAAAPDMKAVLEKIMLVGNILPGELWNDGLAALSKANGSGPAYPSISDRRMVN